MCINYQITLETVILILREYLWWDRGKSNGKDNARRSYTFCGGLYVTTPLLRNLADKSFNTKSVAYADDLTTAGSVENLYKCWGKILEMGPRYGYPPPVNKNMVNYYRFQIETRSLCLKTGVQITTSGENILEW